MKEGEHFVDRALPSLLSQRRDADTKQWKIFFLIFADKETIGFLRSSDTNVCYTGFHLDFIECNFESLEKTSQYLNNFSTRELLKNWVSSTPKNSMFICISPAGVKFIKRTS